ncbi:hypothetical protein WY02_05600 [Pseudonocardia sp. AL041005-10]|nr:hypothetical protein WY02_05600 [Pseudonocardia sp. AL041005-10]
MGKLKAHLVEIPEGLSRIEAELSDVFRLHRSLVEESCKLAQIRDALLSVLMSGKVKVREAERAASEVL